MSTTDRRRFLQAAAGLVATPFIPSIEERQLLAAQPTAGRASAPAEPATDFPCGTLGKARVSRLICGGNLISGYAHARDLLYASRLMKAYFTDEKIMETWALCERHGINTMVFNPHDRRAVELYRRYRKERGGNIQFIAQLDGQPNGFERGMEEAMELDAIAIFLVGNLGDRWSREGDAGISRLRDFVARGQAMGFPTGVAGHELRTVRVCEQHGIAPDFYVKTLHTDDYLSARRPDQTKDVVDNYAVDNYWCKDAQETIEFMRSVSRPWVAYKVLAAGAIHPRRGFRYAFENGADFCLVGMFDFQIAEDAQLAREIVAACAQRSRTWNA